MEGGEQYLIHSMLYFSILYIKIIFLKIHPNTKRWPPNRQQPLPTTANQQPRPPLTIQDIIQNKTKQIQPNTPNKSIYKNTHHHRKNSNHHHDTTTITTQNPRTQFEKLPKNYHCEWLKQHNPTTITINHNQSHPTNPHNKTQKTTK